MKKKRGEPRQVNLIMMLVEVKVGKMSKAVFSRKKEKMILSSWKGAVSQKNTSSRSVHKTRAIHLTALRIATSARGMTPH